MAKTLDQIRAEQRKKGASKPKQAPAPAARGGFLSRIFGSKSQSGADGKNSSKTDDKNQKQPPQTLGEIAISWLKTLGGAIVMVMLLNGFLVASFVVPTGSMENTVMTGDFLFVNKLIYAPSTPQMIPLVNVPIPYYRFPGLREPKRDDVIVFIFPGMREEIKAAEFQYYLKRCVATAGDTLQIRDKQLIINGQSAPLPTEGILGVPATLTPDDHLSTFPRGLGYTRDNYGPIRIPKKGDVIQLTPNTIAQWETFIAREGHEVATAGEKILIDGKEAARYEVERDYCFGMGDNRDNSLDSRYWGFIPLENVVGSPLVVYWSWDTNYLGSSFFSSLFGKFKTIRFGRIGTVIR